MDRCDKAVAAPRNVGDVALAALAIAERAPQSGNVDLEIALFHEDVGPDAVEQLLLAQNLAGPFEQSDEDITCPTAEMNRLVAVQQELLRGKQPEAVERNLVRLVGLVSSHALLRRLASPETLGRDHASSRGVGHACLHAWSRDRGERSTL